MARPTKFRTRGAYKKPWTRMFADGSLVTKDDLHTLGKLMVEHVRKEAMKDIAKQGGRTGRGRPEGLPTGPFKFQPVSGVRSSKIHRKMAAKYPGVPAFLASFDYEIVGQATVKITSTWPFIMQLIEGRGKFKMDWLTQEAMGPKIVNGKPRPRAIPIVKQDGTVIFRLAPKGPGDAWVHPGFAKHSFIQRGIRKGRKAAAEALAKEVAQRLSKGDPTR